MIKLHYTLPLQIVGYSEASGSSRASVASAAFCTSSSFGPIFPEHVFSSGFVVSSDASRASISTGREAASQASMSTYFCSVWEASKSSSFPYNVRFSKK